MRVFISYHRADTEFKDKIEIMLEKHGIKYYSIPENEEFDGRNHQDISMEFIDQLNSCDIVLCLVGRETNTRPYVDHEIHAALKGDIGKRKGIVVVLLETRDDRKNNIDFKTFPVKLADNINYIVLEQFSSFHQRLLVSIEKAKNNSRNKNRPYKSSNATTKRKIL